MASRVRAVILDLGNVLLFHDNALLFRRLGERAGGLGGAEVERRLMAGGLWEGANRGRLDREGVRCGVCGALGVDIPMAEFAPLFSCHFTLHEAVLPRVEGLAGRVPLLLLSNTNWVHADWFLPRLPLLERFDHVLLSCAQGTAKPDAAFFQAALARAGCPAAGAAFFDDVPEYVEAARALGIQAHLFTTAAAFDAQLAALGL